LIALIPIAVMRVAWDILIGCMRSSTMVFRTLAYA